MVMFRIDDDTYINPKTISIAKIQENLSEIKFAKCEFVNNAKLCKYFDYNDIVVRICESLSIIVIADGKQYVIDTEICKEVKSQLTQYFVEMEKEFENYPRTKEGVIKDNGRYEVILERDVYQFLYDFTSGCGIQSDINSYIDISSAEEAIRKKLNIIIFNINESIKESK